MRRNETIKKHMQESPGFLHHTNCPKCQSRDNLGVWGDGHKWCFGCGYYVPSERTLANMVQQTQSTTGTPPPIYNQQENFTTEIPPPALHWLKSYGITDDEIRTYGIVYSLRRDRLILPLHKTTYPTNWVGRYFGSDPTKPRYHQEGTKNHSFVADATHLSSTLVFVEDYISAIKVGRVCAATPILGNAVGTERFKVSGRRFTNLGVWLDPDMRVKTVKTALMGETITSCNIFKVFTDKDPKDYSTEEIDKLIAEQLESGTTTRDAPEPPWPVKQEVMYSNGHWWNQDAC